MKHFYLKTMALCLLSLWSINTFAQTTNLGKREILSNNNNSKLDDNNIDFENQTLNSQNFWIGDGEGKFTYTESGVTITGTQGSYNGVPYWSGFAISGRTEKTYKDLTPDQYNSVPGGAYSGNKFLVVQNAYNDYECITFDKPMQVLYMYCTNSAYAYSVMTKGDSFAGEPFTADDWFSGYISCYNEQGDIISCTEVQLAKNGVEANSKYIEDWQKVNINAKNVKKISFSFDGSRKSNGYLNIPAYMCVDNICTGYSDGDLLYDTTEEGIEIAYTIISAKDKTCKVRNNAYNTIINGHVTIPESVKGFTVVEIGHEAFEHCDGLTGITIPNTVKKIDTEAFYHCTNLLSIDIPNSVKTIRHDAFEDCSSLANVTIGSGLNELEEDVFLGCTLLSNISVSSENTVYDSRNNCNAIIETATNKLILGGKNTTIPNDIQIIGYAAFAYNTGLTSISIPNSVTQIEANAFYCCTGLTNIKIPSSVIRIGGGFTWDDDDDDVSYAREGTITHKKEVRSLPRRSNWREDLTINAFAGCRNLVSISVEEGNPVFDSRDNCNAIIEKATNTLVTACTKTVIPSSVTSIGYGAYGYMDYLTTIDIPQTITSIKQGAFEGCNKLKKIVIPNGVKEIEDYTFEGCSSLTDVSIPNSVVNIGKSAFESCKSLTKVIIPNSVVKLGDYVFLFCSLLEEVSLPNSMKTIGDYAFNGCKALAHVYSEIEKPFAIGENVFPSEWQSGYDEVGTYYSYAINRRTVLHVPYGTTADYKALEGWKIFENIVEPKDGDVFTDNTIENVEMTFVITSAKDKTCKVSSGSSKTAIVNSTKGMVTIPDTAKGYKVISIDDNAFLACTNMTGIFIPNSVESIGASAFNSCVAIDSIAIPASVTNIGALAFADCSGLKSVCVEYEEPFAIGDDVFPYEEATLYVPIGTKKKYKATDGWKNFKAIESGALEEGDVFTAETIEGIVMTFMVTSETEKTCQAGASDGTVAIASCRGKVTIPIRAKGHTVTYISENAFKGCELDSINIPNSVTGIGDEAFYGCINLKSLVIPNGLVNIGTRSFFGCSDLASITIPNSVKSIGQYAFGNCIGLYSVTSLITVPYKLDETVFQCTGDYDADIMYGIAKLFVPIGRSATYAATTGWKKFLSIAEADMKFKLTYILDGEVYKSYDIQAAEIITPEPDPYKEGYIFSGWSNIPYLMPAQDVTVTGSFSIDPGYQAGIGATKTSEAVPETYYSPEGRRLDAPQRGINIIKMSNGTTKKVVVK